MTMSLATRAAEAHPGVAFGGVAGFCARVLAFWFGSLSLVNRMAGLSHPAFDPNIWWIDLRLMPKLAGQLLLLAVGGLLVWHGPRPASGGWRRTATRVRGLVATRRPDETAEELCLASSVDHEVRGRLEARFRSLARVGYSRRQRRGL